MRRPAPSKPRVSAPPTPMPNRAAVPSNPSFATPSTPEQGVSFRFLIVAKLLLFLSVFSVVIVTKTLYRFPEGKAAFFRITTELSLITLLIHWAWEDPESRIAARVAKLARGPVFLAVSAFILCFVLSSFFAYDMHVAFWSTLEREEGAFQIFHYYLFFVLCCLLLTTREDWKWMLRVNLSAAVLMVLYGVAAAVPLPGFAGLEEIPADLGFWRRLVTDGLRFQGSLGNAAYAASYLMFAIFYCFYLWAWGTRPLTIRRISGYATLALFFFGFIWLSGTRGVLVGLLAGTAGFGLLMILRSARPGRAAAAVCSILVVLLSVLFILRH